MSGSSGLSGRYAKALYELAAEKKIISKIVKDFESLKELLKSNDLLKNMIKSPAVSKSNKQSSLIKILKKAKADTLTIKFCGILTKNSRLILINEIIDVFLSGLEFLKSGPSKVNPASLAPNLKLPLYSSKLPSLCLNFSTPLRGLSYSDPKDEVARVTSLIKEMFTSPTGPPELPCVLK